MFVSDILEKLSLSPHSAHQSPLSVNHQIFTSFGQRRCFLNSCYHLNLKHKVMNLVLTTMHHCRCHWLRAPYQVLVCMLMQKRPLLNVYNSLTHCRMPMNNDLVLLWLILIYSFIWGFKWAYKMVWLMVMKRCGLCDSKRHWSQHSVSSTWQSVAIYNWYQNLTLHFFFHFLHCFVPQ